MFNSLRAEFRKLYSVRSTYILTAVILLLSVALVCFWIYGYKNVGQAHTDAGAIKDMFFNAMAPAGLFMGIMAILAVGHEYRYNTILYGLTNINHRSKLFFAKLCALLVWSIALFVLIIGLGIAAFYLGQHIQHVATVAQSLPDAATLGRLLATVTGFVFFGFIIAMLLRSLVGSIALFLVLPTTVESLLSLLLKDNVKYLPFTALGNVANPAPSSLTWQQSLGVVAAYVVVGSFVAYALFSKRDAN